MATNGDDTTPGYSVKALDLATLRKGVAVAVIVIDLSGSTSANHEKLRAAPGVIREKVMAGDDRAGEAVLVLLVVISGGTWFSSFTLLKDMFFPECDTGGGSPILASAGEVMLLVADAYRTLEQHAIRVMAGEVIWFCDYKAGDTDNAAGKKGVQTWQSGLSAMPGLGLTLCGPNDSYLPVARMLMRPDKPQEVELMESMSIENSAVVERLVTALKLLSRKTLNRPGSNPNVRPRRKPPADLVGPKAADRFAK